MRLTFPVLTLSRGGAQRMLAELANRMAERGHEVTMIMPLSGSVEYAMNCTVVRTEGESLKASDFPEGDIIVSNYYTTVPVSQEASDNGKGLHVRLALCYEPPFLPDNSRSFASYHVTRHLLVLSKWQQELVRLIHGLESRVVPIGVSPEFCNLHIREAEIRGLTISAILRKPEGGFSNHRQQEYLLRQMNLVKEQAASSRLYLIIPPAEFAESPELQSLRADGRYYIRTPANDEELCFHYNETDIFVSSGTYDSGSLPGLEAMRCGAALAAVYSGGNMEYCKSGYNCLLSCRYENRLAEDVLSLISDPGLRHRLADQGEADSWRFTWERSAGIFEQELYELWKNSPTP